MSELRDEEIAGLFEPLDDGPGPALPIDPRVLKARIDAAVMERERIESGGRRRSWAAAAVMLVVCLAGAAYAAVRYAELQERSRREAATAAEAAVRESDARRRAREQAPALAPALVPDSVAVPVPMPAPVPDAVAVPVPSPAPTPSSVPAASASELLRRASELRAARSFIEAEATYARVVQRYPSSSEAYVARVNVGILRREHLRDARGALRHLEAALRAHPEGALSEEARWGIAMCYRDLGQAPREASALRELLREHPSSLLRPAAERRLLELGDGARP